MEKKTFLERLLDVVNEANRLVREFPAKFMLKRTLKQIKKEEKEKIKKDHIPKK